MKTLILSASSLMLAAYSASATITFDLRASAVDGALGVIANGGKAVNLIPGQTGSITLQVWAMVQNAGQTTYGVQSIQGSIISATTTAGIVGSLSPSTPSGPFNSGNQVGSQQELSGDQIGDLGQGGTNASTNYILFRKDPNTGGGTQIPSGTGSLYVTNTTPLSATVNPISNGYEFLMGTVTLSISSFNGAGVSTLNWTIPGFTTLINRRTIAAWSQQENTTIDGSTTAQLAVGSPVQLAVPEPSAFGMVMLGALSLVGFRRFALRRAS
jgi:hypothetical protein